ncbi:uncharacterized protein LOC126605499 [Malus sylvestris]|uniref:uncharacterized protein LOC126605499 n=1 Tax=Malus sylvestris TaxID=3752 RepID=UPI0021AC2FE1|nr:uncharacterized protein LOC126605499 [Malus sylvestris]
MRLGHSLHCQEQSRKNKYKLLFTRTSNQTRSFSFSVKSILDKPYELKNSIIEQDQNWRNERDLEEVYPVAKTPKQNLYFVSQSPKELYIVESYLPKHPKG